MIAQAANSQKPIQPADLKANSHEQQRFAQAMKNVEVLYITKRGEEIGKKIANNARKICIAFTTLAARYHQTDLFSIVNDDKKLNGNDYVRKR